MKGYPAGIAELLAELREGISGILGERLLGLYLYGSLVNGGFEPELSDIDLLAVLPSPLEEREFERLREMHAGFARRHPAWDDRIEVLYMEREGLRTFREERSPITVISPGEPLNTKDAGIDWLMNWYLVREQGQTLFGPPPGEFIGPVSLREFQESVRDYAFEWREWSHRLERRGAQAYAVLTACRALFTWAEGRQPSKEDAARWVARKHVQWAAFLSEVLEWRRTMWTEDPDPTITQEATETFVRWAAEELARYS